MVNRGSPTTPEPIPIADLTPLRAGRWSEAIGLALFAAIAIQQSAQWWWTAMPVFAALGCGSLLLGLRGGPAFARLQLLMGGLMILAAAAVMSFASASEDLPGRLSLLLGALEAGCLLLLLGEARASGRRSSSSGGAGDGFALAVATVVLLGLACFSLFGVTLESGMRAWLVALATFSWAWAVTLIPSLLPGGLGLALALLVWPPLMVWQFGSLWLGAAQGRPLLLVDVADRIREGVALPFVWETIRTGRGFAVGVLGVVIWLAARHCRGPFGRLENARATVQLLLTSLLLGAPVTWDRSHSEVTRLAVAPWSGVMPGASPAAELNLAVLPSVLADNPAWADDRPSIWADWAGAYRGRSVVVVALESHAAAYLPGFGTGSRRSRQTSPELWEMRSKGVFFTNYFASGAATRSALWSLATGLPVFNRVESVPGRSPGAARLGSIAHLAASGYRSEWLCGTSPAFDGWNVLWGSARSRWWIDPGETAGFDRAAWTAWGMPDEQLFELGARRIESLSRAGQPYLLGLLTVSNHPPFRFPEGEGRPAFSSDHFGGVRYADFAVARFVERLEALEEKSRPLILITADHGYPLDLGPEGPAGSTTLEGLRIPGLLILPDHRGAGTTMSEMFNHEDVGALVEHLVGTSGALSRFRTGRRITTSYQGEIALSQNTLRLSRGQLFRISGRWELAPIEGNDPDRAPLEAMIKWLDRTAAKLWPLPRRGSS